MFFWPATAAEYDNQYGGISPIAVPMPQSIDVKMTCEQQQFAGSSLAGRPRLASQLRTMVDSLEGRQLERKKTCFLLAALGCCSLDVSTCSQYDCNPTRSTFGAVPGALHRSFPHAATTYACMPVAYPLPPS